MEKGEDELNENKESNDILNTLEEIERKAEVKNKDTFEENIESKSC